MYVKNPTIGADIECFLIRDGKVISAEGLVKGSKYDPFIVAPSLSEFFTTQLDNVLAEVTVPPATKAVDFVGNITTVKDLLLGTLPEGIQLHFYPDNMMDEKDLQTENAQTFGCDVSYSAWDGKPISIEKGKYPNLRSAGFHVHVGYEEPGELVNNAIIKQLDLMLGVPSILIEPKNLRKVLYGKAGEFRNKPYGVEYRTLSSFFAGSEELIKWVYENTVRGIDYLNSDFFIGNEENDCQLIVDAINNADKAKAQYLVDKYNIILP